MRPRLDDGSAKSSWLLHPDGVLGRALLVPADATYVVPLKLSNEAWFSARSMLLPHDWRDRRGAVRVLVGVTDAAGKDVEIWCGTLRAGDRGRPRGARVKCRLPPSTTALNLSVRVMSALRHSSVSRAIWLEPTIIDPGASHITDPPSGPRLASEPHRHPNTPLISVLTPVHDPPAHMLEEAIASVLGQTFSDWELCLVDDGSTDPEVIASLERHASSDSRIRLTRRQTAGGISAATNTALELATGEYIALMDHDDTLTPDALQHVADRIAAQPDLDMIYSDEDVVGDVGLIERHPKPGWSPDHMTALMYTCHLGVYRRELAVELGGFEPQFDGCQDYDFVLRLMERTDRIAHIPEILYHWRAHTMSTAGGDAKPYAYLAQPAAIANHLERTGIRAQVQFTHLPGIHRIVHLVPPSTTIDLVLAVGDREGLTEAAASWLSQPHRAWTVVIAGPTEALDAATDALTAGGLPGSRMTAIPTDPSDDRATALAAAADAATAEHLLLMQTPVLGLTHDWLTRLIGYSNQHQIGAAGPVVLAPDGRIQHAGIAIPKGIPLHLLYGSLSEAAPPVVYNRSAVSGVLATRRALYEQLGGLNPQLQELALIDYCLRAGDRGERSVIVPDARVRISGPDTTSNDLPTLWRLRQTWAQTHNHDPYYNSNYRTDRGDFVLATYS